MLCSIVRYRSPGQRLESALNGPEVKKTSASSDALVRYYLVTQVANVSGICLGRLKFTCRRKLDIVRQCVCVLTALTREQRPRHATDAKYHCDGNEQTIDQRANQTQGDQTRHLQLLHFEWRKSRHEVSVPSPHRADNLMDHPAQSGQKRFKQPYAACAPQTGTRPPQRSH